MMDPPGKHAQSCPQSFPASQDEIALSDSSEEGDLDHMEAWTALANHMCRVCGQQTQTNHKVHFFTSTGTSNDYRNRLVSVTRFLNGDSAFDITRTDGLPNFFCRKCHTRLLTFERAALGLRASQMKGHRAFQLVRSGTHPAPLPPRTKTKDNRGATKAGPSRIMPPSVSSQGQDAISTSTSTSTSPTVPTFTDSTTRKSEAVDTLLRASHTFHNPPRVVSSFSSSSSTPKSRVVLPHFASGFASSTISDPDGAPQFFQPQPFTGLRNFQATRGPTPLEQTPGSYFFVPYLPQSQPTQFSLTHGVAGSGQSHFQALMPPDPLTLSRFVLKKE